jgi:hypothetical protein
LARQIHQDLLKKKRKKKKMKKKKKYGAKQNPPEIKIGPPLTCPKAFTGGFLSVKIATSSCILNETNGAESSTWLATCSTRLIDN